MEQARAFDYGQFLASLLTHTSLEWYFQSAESLGVLHGLVDKYKLTQDEFGLTTSMKVAEHTSTPSPLVYALLQMLEDEQVLKARDNTTLLHIIVRHFDPDLFEEHYLNELMKKCAHVRDDFGETPACKLTVQFMNKWLRYPFFQNNVGGLNAMGEPCLYQILRTSQIQGFIQDYQKYQQLFACTIVKYKLFKLFPRLCTAPLPSDPQLNQKYMKLFQG